MTGDANSSQRAFWNSDFGAKWVTFADDLEQLHAPMNEPLLDRAGISPGMRVLDIGCGSGSVARRAAEMTGINGAVTAVDISEMLLETARQTRSADNSAPIDYTLADAQTYGFPPAEFDRVVSRMGVMFFADPIAAFANLLRAARPGAVFAAVVWRRGEANPWFQIPTEAAIRHLGPVDADPHAPGPLAFAEVDRTVAILQAAGWEDVRGDPMEVRLETRGSSEDAAMSIGALGPAARIMNAKGATSAQVASIVKDIAVGFRQFETAQGLRVPVTMTLLSANAPQ